MMQVNGRPAASQRRDRYAPPASLVNEQTNLSFSFAWRLDPSTNVGRAMAAAFQRLRSSQSETPRLDVEILLASVLNTDRVGLFAHPERPLSAAERSRFEELIERRRRHEPVAYLVGSRSFFGLDFLITPQVLVPRPETELLVEHAILAIESLVTRSAQAYSDAWLVGNRPPGTNGHGPGRYPPYAQFFRPPSVDSGVLMADIGTGSGAIAVSVAHNHPRVMVYATDISSDALAVAQTNAVRTQVADRMQFLHGSLLSPLPQPVDIITANLPYVPSSVIPTLAPDVAQYEPRLALDGGPDGTLLIQQLLSQAPAYLRPGGALLLEIGSDQGFLVADMARQAFPSADVNVLQDFAGLDRLVRVLCS